MIGIIIMSVSLYGALWMGCRMTIGPDEHHNDGWWGRDVSRFTYNFISFFWPLFILWQIGKFFYELPFNIKYTYHELKRIYRKRNE